ncbi:unnamed protein product [Blumeria hordei]|uniref:DUF962 domain-containing protein n=1 Tax=Blumeria hordei TaxID=2867405 RepID=A0A383UZ73_BLUHO|nr:unnamed protein product [Blumeria hordei]
MSLDLEKQLCFYGAYHHNTTNVRIHMICVPLILATSLTLATNSPTLIPLPTWLTISNLPLNIGTMAAIFYGGFYMLLEPVAGSFLFPILLAWTAFSKSLTITSPAPTNKIAIAINLVSWLAQFYGHIVHEGRAPALLDNLVQALVLAPFFVFMEILFTLGYRPELQKRVKAAVQKELQKLKSLDASKIVKSN